MVMTVLPSYISPQTLPAVIHASAIRAAPAIPLLTEAPAALRSQMNVAVNVPLKTTAAMVFSPFNLHSLLLYPF